ncbi:hypothetical protein H3146_04445 [Streptomyces sp. OF3]|uniref:Uncharacterized protein n=1 Tax=Streptomyces alkaliterrae TaxID=2213162 RepID=A0A7W3WHV9_9ACTN|nr:hypothetical protein [Streptomyces alkaliterrae]MBB1252622.1 hypothetical protein [Streptomyces alkaliterrae]
MGDITLPGGGTYGLRLLPAASAARERTLIHVEVTAGPNDVQVVSGPFVVHKNNHGRGAISFPVPKSPFGMGFSTNVQCGESTDTSTTRVTKITGKIPINGAGGFEMLDFTVSRT